MIFITVKPVLFFASMKLKINLSESWRHSLAKPVHAPFRLLVSLLSAFPYPPVQGPAVTTRKLTKPSLMNRRMHIRQPHTHTVPRYATDVTTRVSKA
jgi:hypothetical protein